jgi:hypothetical protein
MVSETESEGAKCYIISGHSYSLIEAIYQPAVNYRNFCKFDGDDGATQRKSQSFDQEYKFGIRDGR